MRYLSGLGPHGLLAALTVSYLTPGSQLIPLTACLSSPGPLAISPACSTVLPSVHQADSVQPVTQYGQELAGQEKNNNKHNIYISASFYSSSSSDPTRHQGDNDRSVQPFLA